MTRNYKRKTTRAPHAKDTEHVQRAIACVVEEKRSIRSVGKEYGIDPVTLSRYIKKTECC